MSILPGLIRVRLAAVTDMSFADGNGIRMVIWFQGCKLRCKGCQNSHTWDINGGYGYDLSEIIKKIDNLTDTYQGITLTGGEPFLQEEAAVFMARHAREKGLDVWVYTGYTYEQLLEENRALLSHIDMLVDGPFVEKLKSFDLGFRGSSNQRYINLSGGHILPHVKEPNVLQGINVENRYLYPVTERPQEIDGNSESNEDKFVPDWNQKL